MKHLETNQSTEITVTTGDKKISFPLYSPEGVEYLSTVWLKLAAQNRLMYEVQWMGIPFIQLAEDMAMMHELLWKLKPDVIVECGVGQCGGLLFYASMMELIGKGRVIGVDIEIREANRTRLATNPLSKRVELIEGSSVGPQTFEQVKAKIKPGEHVLVILDSDHTYDHVAKEMALYHTLVPSGGYLVVMDGGAAHVWDIPRGQAKYRDNHPLMAIDGFVAKHPEFSIDPHFNRLAVTSSPLGFLRRS